MKVGILGCGNMAYALVKGMHLNSEEVEFFTYTPSKTKAVSLANEVGGKQVDLISDIPECDAYMIGCKPQQFSELSEELEPYLSALKKQPLIISIMAAITCESILNKLKVPRILRIMPNTPSIVGAGVNAFYFTNTVESSTQQLWTSLFKSFSKVYTFKNEIDIDIITPFSGSGPAYIFEFARILSAKMMEMGIDEKTSNEMVSNTFFGASKLLVESKEDAQTLRNNVTSKKGVTYEALEVFKQRDLTAIFDEAIDAAFTRTQTL